MEDQSTPKADQSTPAALSFRHRLDSLVDKYEGEPEMLQEVKRVRQKLAEQHLAMNRRASIRKKKRKRRRESRRANR